MASTSLSKTAAPKSDRIHGSKVNKAGSAASKKSSKNIVLSDKVTQTLKDKAEEYNKNHTDKVTLNELKAVFRRGSVAYSTSHRPTITNGAPNSRNAWSFARVNKFLEKKAGKKVKAAYVQDDDLLEKGGEIGSLHKVKSFKTEEGAFDVYDIDKDARDRMSMFTVLKDKKGYIVRNAFVPDNLQKKGIATEFYVKMNEESLAKTGKPLRSTQKRILNSGEVVHELSVHGVAMWESFVRKGLAKKLGTKDYRFLKHGELTDNELVNTPEFKSWFGDSKVVDDNGNPLVVYHSTEKVFNKFNKKFSNQGVFWFSSDREAISSGTVGARSAAAIIPVYISAKKIAGWDEYKKFGLGELKGMGFEAIKLGNNYIAFNPEQIKLADGSNTTFDGSNPDIRYADGGDISNGYKVYVDGEFRRTITPENLQKYYLDSGFKMIDGKLQYQKQDIRFKEGGIILNGSDVQTGQPITIKYTKNTEKAPYMGTLYGQDVEPSGKYITQDETGEALQGWAQGEIHFNNPLVIDVTDMTLVEWKRDLSKQNADKKGKILTRELQKQGYDGIITIRIEKGNDYIGEIIAFDNAIDSNPTNKLEDVGEIEPIMIDNIALPDTFSTYDNLKPILENQGYDLIKKEHMETQTEDIVQMVEETVPQEVICVGCGWQWSASDTEVSDMYVCHQCGFDNTLFHPTMTIQQIAEKHGVELENIIDQIIKGTEHELEHTDNPDAAKVIAMHHIAETNDYYDKLDEKKLEDGDIVEAVEEETPVEVAIIDYLNQEKEEALDVMSCTDSRVFKAMICKTKIEVAEKRILATDNPEEQNCWNEVVLIWKDCLNHIIENTIPERKFKEGGQPCGCGDVYSKPKNKPQELSKGGLAYGNSHDNGGIPAVVKSTGQHIEFEGAEGVVNKRSMQMDKKVEFEGKKMTPCEVISKINQMGGGVKFNCSDVKEIVEQDGDF